MNTTPRNDELIEEFNIFVKKYCGENAPHLLDSDENDGERFRNLISSHRTAERTALIEEIITEVKKIKLGILDSMAARDLFDDFIRKETVVNVLLSHLESDNHTKQ